MKKSMPVYSRFSPSLNEQIDRMSEKLACTKSLMIAMAAQVGINYLTTVLDPENAVSAKKLAEIIIEAEKMGVDFKVPEGLVE